MDAENLCADFKQSSPCLLIWDDLLLPTPAFIEGMLEALNEFDAVVAPSFDSHICAISTGEHAHFDAPSLSECLLGGNPRLPEVVSHFVQEGGEIFCQAPWFRGADMKACASALDYAKALDATGDQELVAIRTLKALEGAVKDGAGE